MSTLLATIASLLLILTCQPSAAAEQPSVTASAITRIEVLHEADGMPLSLQEVRSQFYAGAGEEGHYASLGFGIGANPVWLRLTLENGSDTVVDRRLSSGVTWIDRLDVYHIAGDKTLRQWTVGDRKIGTENLAPGVGFTFDLMLPPGLSEVFIRAETDDPLILPVLLQTRAQARSSDTVTNLTYGAFYGFLFALFGYNLMLFLIFRHRRYLYYSIYISSFAILNVGYTGQGYAWIWSQYPELQRFSILALMVLHSIFGLMFSSSFLLLRDNLPRAYRFIQLFSATGVAAMLLFIGTGNQFAAALFAFAFLTTTAIIMIVIGILSLHKLDEARYFLAAVTASMAGMFITSLTVWSVLPFSASGFHAAEVGILIEAVILAVILARQLHIKEHERISAKQMAAFDPLTGLRNRRSFLEAADKSWSIARRSQRPLSLLMIDIDHFKSINDQYGHAVGDQALIQVSSLLSGVVRNGDLLARWGGEEMVLLMPETRIKQAATFAERLRKLIDTSPLEVDGTHIPMTASFGVAEYTVEESLEMLIAKADQRLYAAKERGRNRVETSPPVESPGAAA